MTNTNHIRPALFSLLFPGIGQVLKKQYSKAYLIWLIIGLLVLCLHHSVLIPCMFWEWNVYDAYSSGEWFFNSINRSRFWWHISQYLPCSLHSVFPGSSFSILRQSGNFEKIHCWSPLQSIHHRSVWWSLFLYQKVLKIAASRHVPQTIRMKNYLPMPQ